MKKILSMVLAIMMLVSAIPVAYAAECGACWGGNVGICEVCGNESHCNDCGHCWACASNDECACADCTTNDYQTGTQVSYDAADDDTIGDGNNDGSPDNVEYYTVTVPAKLAPGESGDVIAAGTWASNRKLKVSLKEDTVKLTNTISNADEKVLDLTFENIALIGNNVAAVSETKQVSVADISAALFGKWKGHFEYNVEMVGNPEIITFTVSGYGFSTYTLQAIEGMTWEEWLGSEYNSSANAWIHPNIPTIVFGDDWVCTDTDTCEIMSGVHAQGTNCVIPSDVIIAGHSYGLHSRYT